MFDFEVKLAQDKKEIQDALRLRYEIFRLQMQGNSKLPKAYELDTDIYDKFCEHLIVIDRMKNKVVGTYRLLLGSKVDKTIGFACEEYFDICNIKKLAKEGEIMELGRSCVHRDYRSRPVINLLWTGIAKYIKDYNVGYLFGAPRLYTKEPGKVSRIFKFIKERFYAPSKYRVYPKFENRFKGLKQNIAIPNPRQIWHRLPPLIKGYIKAGVVVCGLPAINPHLDSVTIFVLLDVQKIPPAYKEHFF